VEYQFVKRLSDTAAARQKSELILECSLSDEKPGVVWRINDDVIEVRTIVVQRRRHRGGNEMNRRVPNMIFPPTFNLRSLLRQRYTVWRSGNGIRRINEVTLRRSRLVLGLVTVFGQAYHLGMQPPIQVSLLYLLWTRNVYWPKCGDAPRLGVKAGWLITFVDKHVGGR